MKKLTAEQFEAIKTEVKMMLHASRDTMRNLGIDSTKISFKINCGFYGEAFGILRALQVLGYGKFGAINHEDTLNNLFFKLEQEVLEEENFNFSELYSFANECDYCLNKYGKDGAGRRR